MDNDIKTTVLGLLQYGTVVVAFFFPKYVVMTPDVQNAAAGFAVTLFAAVGMVKAYYTNKKG